MSPALALLLALSWVQVRSDTFIVKSPVGADRAAQVLRDLENFHQLMGSSFGFLNPRLPDLPIEVLLINDPNQLNELEPEYNGHKLRVAGFYQRGEDRDFIILTASSRTASTRVVYHELTHYFVGRAVGRTPAWLSEGMAEYFSFAEINDNGVQLGDVPEDRLKVLKDQRLLSLKELFAVDDDSPYYNESDKANIFYAESWAFVHFLYHGGHLEEFKNFLRAIAQGPANLTDFTKEDLTGLNAEFHTYLQDFIRTVPRNRFKPEPIKWTMSSQPISELEAEMSIAEIFLANGRLDLAKKHLEKLEGMDDEFPRASYYRGILARISGVGNARDLFVDALMDPSLAARAAVQLVKMREYQVPAARVELEKAAQSGKAFPDVYWALAEIYADDTRRILQSIHASQAAAEAAAAVAPVPSAPVENADATTFLPYSNGSCANLQYQVLSEKGFGPLVISTVDPYFPDELRQQKLSGQVVLDVEVTEQGDVGGMWLVSSTPDVFGNLATAAVRQWRFDPGPSKIRLILEFHP